MISVVGPYLVEEAIRALLLTEESFGYKPILVQKEKEGKRFYPYYPLFSTSYGKETYKAHSMIE